MLKLEEFEIIGLKVKWFVQVAIDRKTCMALHDNNLQLKELQNENARR